MRDLLQSFRLKTKRDITSRNDSGGAMKLLRLNWKTERVRIAHNLFTRAIFVLTGAAMKRMN